MKSVTKVEFLLFLIFLIILGFVFLSFYLQFGLFVGLMTTLISWSFYILCIPAFHGKIAIGIPFKIITKKELYYPEKYLWTAALILNIFSLILCYRVYFTSIITHLLAQILLNPWPMWIIIFVSAFGTFYKFIVGYKNFYSNKNLHYPIRFFLILMGIFSLLYFSFNKLIILLNARI